MGGFVVLGPWVDLSHRRDVFFFRLDLVLDRVSFFDPRDTR